MKFNANYLRRILVFLSIFIISLEAYSGNCRRCGAEGYGSGYCATCQTQMGIPKALNDMQENTNLLANDLADAHCIPRLLCCLCGCIGKAIKACSEKCCPREQEIEQPPLREPLIYPREEVSDPAEYNKNVIRRRYEIFNSRDIRAAENFVSTHISANYKGAKLDGGAYTDSRQEIIEQFRKAFREERTSSNLTFIRATPNEIEYTIKIHFRNGATMTYNVVAHFARPGEWESSIITTLR